MLLITPLIAELERLYKGVEIDIVAEGPAAVDVFATFFSVRNIYCLPLRGFKHPVAFLSLLSKIRKNRYDLIIDPCLGSGFSRILTRLCRGQRKLGFDEGAGAPGLTHVVPKSMAPPHMAKRPVSLVRSFASPPADSPTDFPPLDIRLSEAERTQGQAVVRELLQVSGQPAAKLAIGIFANATGAKRYPSEWWRDFIDALREAFPQCGIVEIIPGHGRSMLDSRWPGYYSNKIRRMGAVMAGLDLMISADCGVMHLAVASRVPTIGLFAVTDANVYGPYGCGNSLLDTSGCTAREVAGKVAAVFTQCMNSGSAGARLAPQINAAPVAGGQLT
jgi:ADP-heptose:LPS heptosyltransferase